METTFQDTAVPQVATALIPTHWLDITPVASTDRPCIIEDLDVHARVSGLYARVTQTMRIGNPNRRPISASLVISLPDRAVVCGYALDIEGQMIDGVVVEKEKARVVFETEQRIAADPGLVEAVRGNMYRTRVYPVPAEGTRTFRLSYVAPLLLGDDGSATLELPMPAEELPHRTIRIEVEMLDCPKPVIHGLEGAQLMDATGLWCMESDEHDVTAEQPVLISLPELPAAFALLEKDEDGTVWFSASEIESDTQEQPTPAISALTVLWDVSGSRATVDHAKELGLLRSYCEAETIQSLTLVTFSNQVHDVTTFGTTEALLSHIEALRYDGATDLIALATALYDVPGACDGIDNGSVCVLFSDGLDTLSDIALSFPPGCDVVAIVSGKERDTESLRQACGGLAYDLALAPKDADALAQAFAQAGTSGLVGVAGSGIADLCDASAAGSGRRTVIGRLVDDETSITLAAGGEPLALRATDARDGTVIATAWAARRVAQLSPRASHYTDELLKLGRRFGVVSPVTSLLVLEDLDQWLRYDIEPPKTWKSMRRSWLRARLGRMRLDSRIGMEEAHRAQLEEQWAELLKWWERDYSKESLDDPASEGRDRLRMDLFADEVYADCAPIGIEEDSYADSALPTGYVAESYEESTEESGADEPDQESQRPALTVSLRPWMPNKPYLDTLDEALVTEDDINTAYDTYHQLRREYVSSPSFFLDCAGWFFVQGADELGARILSNLAEMGPDDAAMLRVMGWRLRESGRLDEALVVLRRVLKLRAEDSQSYRDVALTLTELARKAYASGDELTASTSAVEAGQLYRKIALTPWARRAMAIALFAVEELNVLRAWVAEQKWQNDPILPDLGSGLEGVLESDLRITLAWDADETDVDIHVTEPSGEEAYYGHRNTRSGGRVSEDITDGFGPELYEVRKAIPGSYLIRAHYYASHQQSIFGPASCTLTVYTDWGRANQAQQVTSTRLEAAREMMVVGTAQYGDAPANMDENATVEKHESDNQEPSLRELASTITVGMPREEVYAILGRPPLCEVRVSGEVYLWHLGGGCDLAVTFDDEERVSRVIEEMPWGEQLIFIQ